MDKAQTRTKLTVAALLLGLFMAALDQTIVSTAITTILQEFGGLDYFVWVFSAYMIASVIATPIFGKLSDMYGRKLFFLLGLIVFLIGSILCGAAQNMMQLIIFRAIQGIGGGALMPLAFAVIFDIFPPEQRGKMNGLFGAVFGLSSVFGPLAGAFFTDQIHWRWVFYINVPIGIVAFFLILIGYKESARRTKQTIDYVGIVLLTATILSFMFALELGGKEFAWGSWQIVSLFAGFAVFLVGFLYAEAKVSNPIVALPLFKNTIFTVSQVGSFLYGAVMIGGATYIPLFIQGVFGESASSAGQVLTPMMIGVVVSSMLGGRFVGKFPYRNIMLVSVTLMFIALCFLATIDVNTSRLVITLYMIMVGLSIGVNYVVFNVSVMHRIDPQFKGAAVSLITFFRTIGAALGVTVFGVLQNRYLTDKLGQVMPNMGEGEGTLDPNMLLSEEFKAAVPPDVFDRILVVLAESIAFVFQWSILIPVLIFGLLLLLGRTNIETEEQREGARKPSFE